MRRLQKSPEQAYADISHRYSHGLQECVGQAFPQPEVAANCLISLGSFVYHKPVPSPSESFELLPPTTSCSKKSHSLIRTDREQTRLVYSLSLTDGFTELSPSCMACSTQRPFIVHVAPFGTFPRSLFILRWGPEPRRLINTDLFSAVALVLFLVS